MFKQIDEKLKKPSIFTRFICLAMTIFLVILSFGDIFHAKAQIIEPQCDIQTGSPEQIPASCEGKDVVVRGSGVVVFMDNVPVWQSDPGPSFPGQKKGDQCGAGGSSSCDTKRHFKSLTVKDGAIVTHHGLTRSEIVTGNINNIPEQSLADEKPEPFLWKKVDIVVEETIKLESGGRIDVTGKGYPGAYFSQKGQNDADRYYCGDMYLGGLVGATKGFQPQDKFWPIFYPSTRPNFQSDFGFGPGGGFAFSQRDKASGGGASFAGEGKPATSESPSGTYNYLRDVVGSLTGEKRLEWGSGGGSASHVGNNKDVSCANGGAGGGKIDLKAQTLDISNTGTYNNVIQADGEIDGTIDGKPALHPFMFFDDSNSVGSGGGSGGVVRLDIQNIISDLAKAGPSVANGVNPTPPTPENSGKIVDLSGNLLDIANSTYKDLRQVSAKGGWRSNHNRPGDGSGGGGGWLVLGASDAPVVSKQERKVRVKVWWMENGAHKEVKYFTILKDITP